MATWPATLPKFVLSDGYSETLPDGLLGTEMDAGPDKVRRRFTAGTRELRVTVVCTSAQIDIFEAFLADDIAGGALPFDWVHPRTQAATSLRLMRNGDRADVNITPERGARFWRVAMGLEILP